MVLWLFGIYNYYLTSGKQKQDNNRKKRKKNRLWVVSFFGLFFINGKEAISDFLYIFFFFKWVQILKVFSYQVLYGT